MTHLATDLPAAVGSLYAVAGDTDRAIAAYQEAVDHLDRTVSYYHGGEITAATCLPALYAANGQHEKAIAVYQRIIQKDPEKWDWYISMAGEYEAMGQTEKALALRRKWDPSGQLLNKPAPDLEMCDQAGKSVSLAKLRGRPVVLFFRNSAYPRQDVVMRELDALQRRYASQGLAVVCLARLVDMGKAADQAPKNHAYPLLLGADSIYARYGVGESSMLYIVDPQGRLVTRYLGYGYDPGEERWLEQTVRKLLAPPVANSRAGDIILTGYSNPARPGRRQMLLRARVLEVDKQRAQELGINWGSVAPNDRGLAISLPFLFGQGAAGRSSPTLQPTAAALRTLVLQNVVNVLCESSLPVREGEKAMVHIGGEIPIHVQRGKDDSGASVEYRPFGILLEADAPSISKYGILLHVRPGMSMVNPRTIVSQHGSGVLSLRSDHADRVAHIRSGSSLAIGGGMLQDQGEKNPVLSGLFRIHRFQKGESELIILLTPELREDNQRHES